MLENNPDSSAIQVRFAGAWYDAHILTWSLEEDRWSANVRWWPPRGESLLGMFPESDVRGH